MALERYHRRLHVSEVGGNLQDLIMAYRSRPRKAKLARGHKFEQAMRVELPLPPGRTSSCGSDKRLFWGFY
jgi:hypothetical protein